MGVFSGIFGKRKPKRPPFVSREQASGITKLHVLTINQLVECGDLTNYGEPGMPLRLSWEELEQLDLYLVERYADWSDKRKREENTALFGEPPEEPPEDDPF